MSFSSSRHRAGAIRKRRQTRISAAMVNYKDQLVRFMPGRRPADRERAFFAIFSTMIGAIALARMMRVTAMRQQVLDVAKQFLLESFTKRPRRRAATYEPPHTSPS